MAFILHTVVEFSVQMDGEVLKFSHLHLVGVISHCTFENGTKPLGKRHVVYGSFGSVYERVGGLGRSRKAQEK